LIEAGLLMQNAILVEDEEIFLNRRCAHAFTTGDEAHPEKTLSPGELFLVSASEHL
jgi:hypothetical protein